VTVSPGGSVATDCARRRPNPVSTTLWGAATVIIRPQVLALALAWALTARLAIGQQRPEDVAFTLTRVALNLRVDYARRSLSGSETLYLRNVATHAVVQVPFLLNRLMAVSRVTGTAGAGLKFSQAVVVFEDDSIRQVNAVVVSLARPVAPGDSVAIAVHYGGRLVGYTETGSLYIKDNIDHDFTIIREDAYAFPVLGLPSWSANRSMAREPFAFFVQVTVPADLVVATGGQPLEATRRDSLVTWTYQSSGPVPFLNIAIAPYRVLDSGGVRIFHFSQDSAGARMIERAVTGAVARYTGWYGTLGQDLHLTVMEIPEGWGSQASLTAGIIETADAFRDRAQLHQVYHELSHLWNPTDLDRPSPRWNEGLASFLEWRMAAELDGWDGWEARLDRLEQSVRSGCEPRRPCATVPFAAYGKSGLTALSYQVGALTFYSLYKTLGADAFDRAYREFFRQYRDRGATSQDLIAAFNRVDPASERIFADWFSTTRWYTRLARGEPLRQILNGPGRP